MSDSSSNKIMEVELPTPGAGAVATDQDLGSSVATENSTTASQVTLDITQGNATGIADWAKPRRTSVSSPAATTNPLSIASSAPAEEEPAHGQPHSRTEARMAHMAGLHDNPGSGPPAATAAASDDPKLPGFKERFAAFSAMTTAHGLAPAMDDRYTNGFARYCRFTVWMILTLAGISVFAWVTAQQYSDVGQYPVIVETNTTSSTSMDIPQLTICTFTATPPSTDPEDLIAEFVLGCYIVSVDFKVNFCMNNGSAQQYWRVVNSTWNTFSYSACFSLFGIGSTPPPPGSAFASAGYKNTMEIMLDVGFGQRGNGGDNLFADGVQIAIQPSNQFPLPVTGFTAAPGQNTVASISKRTISRQNLPYNPETKGCSNDQRYTMESCQQLCSSHQLLNQLVAQGPTDLFTNVTLAQFKESVVEDQQSGFICPQQCSPSCFQEEYSVSTSLRSQTKDFRTQQCNANTWRNLCLQNATDPSQVCAYDPNQPGQCLPDPVEFAERVVSLTVYPSTLSVVNVNESPKYQAWSILSGIGGNLGLLLGFSLLTVFEWAEFFLFGTCCYRYYAKCLRSKPWSP